MDAHSGPPSLTLECDLGRRHRNGDIGEFSSSLLKLGERGGIVGVIGECRR